MEADARRRAADARPQEAPVTEPKARGRGAAEDREKVLARPGTGHGRGPATAAAVRQPLAFADERLRVFGALWPGSLAGAVISGTPGPKVRRY